MNGNFATLSSGTAEWKRTRIFAPEDFFTLSSISSPSSKTVQVCHQAFPMFARGHSVPGSYDAARHGHGHLWSFLKAISSQRLHPISSGGRWQSLAANGRQFHPDLVGWPGVATAASFLLSLRTLQGCYFGRGGGSLESTWPAASEYLLFVGSGGGLRKRARAMLIWELLNRSLVREFRGKLSGADVLCKVLVRFKGISLPKNCFFPQRGRTGQNAKLKILF